MSVIRVRVNHTMIQQQIQVIDFKRIQDNDMVSEGCFLLTLRPD